MDISDWQDAPRPISPKSGADFCLPPIVFGVIGTLIFHVFIVQSVYSEFMRNRVRPDIQKPGQLAALSSGSGESLVMIDLAAAKKGGQIKLDDSISQSLGKPDLKILLDVDIPPIFNVPMALEENEGSDAVGTAGKKSEQSRLFGIYTGQIQARIERVWRRPRTPVIDKRNQSRIDTGESFQCEVQIVQDAMGNVQEVLLPRCNGTVGWRRSLVIAIQQASPLPAPPDSSVFTSSITLRFLAFPYGSGGSDDEYELPSVQSAKNSN